MGEGLGVCPFLPSISLFYLTTILKKDQTNPLLRSDETFQIYITALIRSDPNAPIQQAVERREQVLALPLVAQAAKPAAPPPDASALSSAAPLTATSSPPSNSIPASSSNMSGSASIPSPPPMLPLSRSQEIAQAVLATRSAGASFTSSIFGDSAAAKDNAIGASSLLAAAGGGGKENPIHVTVSERMLLVSVLLISPVYFVITAKGTTVYRIVRFLGLMALSGFCKCFLAWYILHVTSRY